MEEEKKKWITPKSVIHFLIASVFMFGYFLLVNWGLMEVQGLDFFYLWNAGAPAGGH